VGAFTYSYKGTGTTSHGPTSEAPVAAGTYSITATSADANYTGSRTLSFTIAPKRLAITANAITKDYGAPDPGLTYQSSGLIGDDPITGTLLRASGENVGNYSISQGTLEAGTNYAIDFTGADLVIGPVPIAPTNFLASQTSNQRVDLSWTPDNSGNSACTGYKISYKAAGDADWSEASVAADAITSSLSGLTPATEYQLRIGALNGSVTSSYTTTSINTWTALESWRFANFGTISNSGNAADSANPSGDGLRNLIKYALGLSAAAVSSSSNLEIRMNADQRLELTFLRAREELSYIVQGSSDLSSWTDLAVNPGSTGTAVKVTDSSPADSSRRFLRLKISY
jgi:hypothetical protein